MASTLLREHVALRKLIWVGPLTIVSTAIANLIKPYMVRWQKRGSL